MAMICSSLNRLFLTTPPLALAGHRKWRSHISNGLISGEQVTGMYCSPIIVQGASPDSPGTTTISPFQGLIQSVSATFPTPPESGDAIVVGCAEAHADAPYMACDNGGCNTNFYLKELDQSGNEGTDPIQL